MSTSFLFSTNSIHDAQKLTQGRYKLSKFIFKFQKTSDIDKEVYGEVHLRSITEYDLD